MMTADAIAVLNRRQHGGHSRWYWDGAFVRGADQYEALTEFEAQAIAEKYVREESSCCHR